MLGAWQGLPCEDGFQVPGKASFSPTLLTKHLANMGMAEHMGEGRLNIRLTGTNSREFWGQELTGTEYDALPGGVPEGAMVPPMILEALFRQPCGMRSLREAEDHDGLTWQCDMFSLPLADKVGVAKYLLFGYRVFPKDEGAAYAWKPGFADLTTARLIGAEFIDLGHGVPT